MIRQLHYKNPDIALLTARISLALVMFPHGAQKLLGWFNGFGFTGTMHYFTDTVHLPWIVGFMVIITEFFGPIGLLLGIGTRFWATAILGVSIGIIATIFHQYFFMNWFNAAREEGYEFFLLTAGLSLTILFAGSGKYSLMRLRK